MHVLPAGGKRASPAIGPAKWLPLKTSSLSKSVDYIIVGQGIAGSSLAYALLQAGHSVMVLAHPERPGASHLAAGLFNPITGRKMTLTWQAHTLFEQLVPFYQGIEAFTGQRFFYPRPIFRPFLTTEEQNDWMGRSADPAYAPFVQKVHTQPFLPQAAHNPHGGLLLKGCGYVFVPHLLAAMRTRLQALQSWQAHNFEPGQVTFQGSHVMYQNIKARGLVLCTGRWQHLAPFFGWLPFQPVKGEVLTVQAPLSTEVLLNRGVYMVPMAAPQNATSNQATFRVGATYNWRQPDSGPTESGRAEIEQKLQALVKVPYTVLEHHAGVRPATKDRKPLVGPHPEKPRLFVFNGLGTKGISMAPWLATQLVNFMESGTKIAASVDVNRYISLYN